MNKMEFQDRCDRLCAMLDHLPHGFSHYIADIKSRLEKMYDEAEILDRVTTDLVRKLQAHELHVASILGEDYEHEKYGRTWL